MEDKRWMGTMIGEAILTDDRHCMVIWPSGFGEASYVDARLLNLYLMWLDSEIDQDTWKFATGQVMVEQMMWQGELL